MSDFFKSRDNRKLGFYTIIKQKSASLLDNFCKQNFCAYHTKHSLRNLLGFFLHDLQLVKGFLCFSFSVSQNIGIVSALFGVSEDRWWWRKLGVHVRIRRCQQRWHASAAMLLSLALSQRVHQKKRGYRAGKPYPTKKTIDRGPQYRRSSRVGSSSVLFFIVNSTQKVRRAMKIIKKSKKSQQPRPIYKYTLSRNMV